MEIKFVPLSFINTDEEILKQIKNTVLISYLFEQYQETTLEYYLDSTQYGYTASALESGKHKLVRITDINDGNVNWDTVPFCDCDVENKYLLKDHDILVARTGGTTGKSFIVNNPPNNAVFASYLIRLRLNAKADIEFITCFLNSYAFWSQIIEMKAGSAMPNVNAEKLKTLKLPKCDLRIQKEIISIFNNSINTNGFQSLFDKVASVEQLFLDNKSLSAELTHQLSLVKKLRQQLLQDAVQGKLVAQDPGDEPAGELLKRIKAEKQKLMKEGKLKKEKELPAIKAEEIPFEVPEGWVWCRLGEMVSILGDGLHGTPNYDSDGSCYFINGNNLINGKIEIKDNTKRVSDSEYNKHKKVLTDNTVFVSINGTLGNLAYYNAEKIILGKSACYFNLYPQIDKYYVGIFIRSAYFLRYAIEVASETTIKNVSLKSMRLLPIPLPPLSEQGRIVQKLEELMGMCEALEGSIGKSVKQNERLLGQVLREALKEGVVEVVEEV